MNRASVLLLLGNRAGRRAGPGAIVHRWALVAAAAVTMVTAWVFVAAHTVNAERTGRIAARQPLFLPEGADSAAVARWRLHADFYNDQQFLVFYVKPVQPGVSPPPGLPRWPEPGEVFLSPALLDDAQSGALRERYGNYAGTIAKPGLADNTERIAYFRPRSDAAFDRSDDRSGISGFGVEPELMGGDLASWTTLNPGNWTIADIFVLIICVLALPATLLVVIAVRSNAERRDRRLAMLDALGAPRSARAWVLAGEALMPLVVGTALGCLLATLTTLMDTRLPLVGYVVNGDDIATARGFLAPLAVTVVGALLILTVLAQLRSRAQGETKPRTLRARFRGWSQGIFVLGITLAIWGAATSDGGIGPGYPQPVIAFLVGIFLALATLPAVLGSLAGTGGRLVASLGENLRWAAAVVGGRWLAARPTLVARLCAALVVGMGLLVQVQVQQAWVIHRTQGLAGNFPGSAMLAGDELVAVRTLAAEIGADRFIEALGQDRVLRVFGQTDQRPLIVGTCPALRALGQLRQCSATPANIEDAYTSLGPIGEALRYGTEISEPRVAIATAPPATGKPTEFFVLNSGGQAGLEQVQRAAYATLSKPYVSTSGQHWIVGGIAGAAAFDWLVAFGLAGVAVLTLAGLLAATGIFFGQVSSLGILTTYDGRRRLYIGIAGWNLALPLIVGGLVGAMVAGFLGWLGLQVRQAGELRVDLLISGAAGVTVLAAILALVCGEATARAVRGWHPSND